MARWLVFWLVVMGGCARPLVAPRMVPARQAVPPVASGVASGVKSPVASAAVTALHAVLVGRLVPHGYAVERWVAGSVIANGREQLVIVARKTKPESEQAMPSGPRTLLVFDCKRGRWRQRLASPEMLPCAGCGSPHIPQEVSVELSLSDEQPAAIRLRSGQHWMRSVGVTIRHIPNYGFFVTEVDQFGVGQSLTRSLPFGSWHRSVRPLEGSGYFSSTTASRARNGPIWFSSEESAIPPRWIAAETADYHRLLDLLSDQPDHDTLPLNPARSLDSY